MSRSIFLVLVSLLTLHTSVFAQQGANEPVAQLHIEKDETNGIYRLSWWGRAGWKYFVQQSEDLSGWDYMPIIEYGADAPLEWGLTSTGDRGFFRLRLSDDLRGDIDGDRVWDEAEILQGTDPFSRLDADGDQLFDDWELHVFGTLVNGGGDDTDGDLIPNLQEQAGGSDPNDPQSRPQLETRYALIDLGPGLAWALNDSGQVVGWTDSDGFLWDKGKLTSPGGFPTAISASGVVVGSSGENAQNSGYEPFQWVEGDKIDVPPFLELLDEESGFSDPFFLMEIHDINDSGIMVGVGVINGDYPQAFRWDGSTSFEHLTPGTPANPVDGIAQAINGDGVIAGVYWGIELWPAQLQRLPAILEDGAATYLDARPGSVCDINQQQQVVGYAWPTGSPSYECDATLWSEELGAITLGEGLAFALTDDLGAGATIVGCLRGEATQDATTSQLKAVIWKPVPASPGGTGSPIHVAHFLSEAISSDVGTQYELVGANDINAHGVIAGAAIKYELDDDGQRIADTAEDRAIVLIPIDIDFITRDPETGDFQNLGGLVNESDPRPSLKFTDVQATVLASGALQIAVEGETRDFLSEFLESGNGEVSSVELFLNGKSVATIGNLESADSGVESLPPWQKRDSTKTFAKTITLPGLTPGAHTLVAKTNTNALGQRGWGSASVIVEKIEHGDIQAANTPLLSFFIPQDLAANTQDSITLTLNGNQTVTLTEPENQQGVFEGTATTDGAPRQVRAMLPTSSSFTSEAADSLGIQFSYEGSAGRIYTIEGEYSETGVATRQFTSPAPLSTVESYENLRVVGVTLGVEQEGRAFQPTLIRIMLPESVASWIGQAGWLKAELNGTEVQIEDHEGLTPGNEPPAGMKHFYITDSGDPVAYLANDGLIGTHFPSQVASDGEFRLELKKREGGDIVYKSSAAIGEFAPLNEEPPQTSMSAASGESTPEPPVAQATSTEAEYAFADVKLLFELMFGKVGLDLLTLYENAGVQVEITSWFGLSTYSFDGIRPNEADGLPLAQKKTPKIYINTTRCDTVVDAATALFNALQDLHNKSAVFLRISLNPGDLQWNQVLDSANSDPDDLVDAWRNRSLAPIEDTLVGFTETVKFGMSFTLAGDAIVTTAETGQALEEGNTVSAAVLIGMALTPEVIEKMWRWCKRYGKVWRCDLPGNVSLELTEEVLNALRVVPRKGTPLQKLEALRPLIDNGTITRDGLEAMWRGGYLKSKYPRKELADNLGGSLLSKLTHAPQHDYPVAKELEFILRGIDINAKSSGRWLPKEFHKIIHGKGTSGQGWGPGGPWNFQWDRFFAETPNATRDQIENLLDQLRSLTSDFTKTADQIEWPYKP